MTGGDCTYASLRRPQMHADGNRLSWSLLDFSD